jgi:2-polyprenyl-3-methyl-5-hydroxy-6-metoxy-1,4-benzoquinol methylase
MSSNLINSNRRFPSCNNSNNRPCPICNQEENRIAIYEAGVEHRFGMPVVPSSDYGLLACKQCGLHYLNVELNEDYLTELYSQESVKWRDEYIGEASVVWNGGSRQDEVDRFNEVASYVGKFRKESGARWLDFGCQTGEFGEVCGFKYNAIMSGVEVSIDYAKTAEVKWGQPGRVKSSLKPFVDMGEYFDVISALETLEHLASPWKTIADFKKIISKNGLLIVTVPSAHYFLIKYLFFRAFRILFNKKAVRNRATYTGCSIFGLCHTHPYNFSPKSMRLMLESNGFDVVFTGGVGWSRNFWPARALATLISLISIKRLQIFPSLLIVAKPKLSM